MTREEMLAGLRNQINHIEKLAFDIPPPNPFTPQIAMAIVQIRAMLTAWEGKDG